MGVSGEQERSPDWRVSGEAFSLTSGSEGAIAFGLHDMASMELSGRVSEGAGTPLLTSGSIRRYGLDGSGSARCRFWAKAGGSTGGRSASLARSSGYYPEHLASARCDKNHKEEALVARFAMPSGEVSVRFHKPHCYTPHARWLTQAEFLPNFAMRILLAIISRIA